MKRIVPLLLLALAAAGCGPASGVKYRIAVIPKGTSHQFWKSVHAGAAQAAKELGDVEIVWKGPVEENNTAGQIQVVKNMITSRVDGIVLAPNHSESLVDVVQEANEEGIPVVIFDSGLGDGAKVVSYVATDNFHAGELAADELAKAIGGEGNVILLRYRAGSESTEQREEGFLEGMKQHPGVKILSSDQYGDATAKTALEKTKQLLVLHGDELDGIFAVCEPNAIGVLEALKDAGLAGKVKFVAFDPADVLITGLEQGTVHGIVLQDPVQMGYLAVKKMVEKLKQMETGEGEKIEPRISTGEFVATKENMGEDPYPRLLRPRMFGE